MRKHLVWLAGLCLLFMPLTVFAETATLTWTAESDPSVLGYKLYQGTVSGQYGAPVDVGKVTTYPVTLPTLTLDQTYFYAVTAYNAVGESPKSAEVSKLVKGVPPAPALIAPTNFTAVTAQGATTLSWDAMPGATGYFLRIHLQGAPYGPCAEMVYCGPMESFTSKTVTLAPGTYDAWVHSATSDTVYSAPTNLTPLLTVPAPPVVPPPPTGLVISAATPDQISIMASAADCPTVTFSASAFHYRVTCGN